MNISQVIKRPSVTEKSHREIIEHNKYTLIVDPHANKHMIKRAVEELFSVPVLSVSIIRKNSITKKVGKLRRVKVYSGIKKAIVALPKGKKIPLFEFEGKSK